MATEDLKKYSHIDYFFYYGKNPLEEECASDLVKLLFQPKRALFYSRSEGAGVSEYENYPNAITLQVGLRYDIAQSVAVRNTLVPDGREGYPDRRIAVSQFSIKFLADSEGNLDVSVLYFLYANYAIPQNITLPIGRK